MGKVLSNSEFINFCIKKHGDKYNYDKCLYKGKYSKVIITCAIHGDFIQTANEHRHGANCPKCVIDNYKKPKYSNEDILKLLNNFNNTDYDYSNVLYSKWNEKIEIRCKKHNSIFHQEFNIFIKTGSGCKKCQYEKSSKSKKLSHSQVEFTLNKVHNNKYTYIIDNNFSTLNKINIVCPKHGVFSQFYLNHYQGKGCPKCGNNISKNESEIFDFIKSFGFKTEDRNRTILNGKEIDILIKDLNIGIEYNGLKWHSDKFKDINYHIDKTILAKNNGINLIHIFEDEWVFKKDICKSRLLNILGMTPNKIYARETVIKEIQLDDYRNFLNLNHIQGFVGGKIYIGLYKDNVLVSAMSFGNLRKNLGSISKENHYELLRFCNKLNTSVIGGASKLFKYFIKNYNPDYIISYADRRWSQGNLYYNLGFNKVGVSKPNYFYLSPNFIKRESRFKYRKDVLVKMGYDSNKTEREIMIDKNYSRIYDCGNIKFEWFNIKEDK